MYGNIWLCIWAHICVAIWCNIFILISIEFTDGISSNITPLHCHISINEKIRSVFRQFIKLERQYMFIQPIKDLKLWKDQTYILCWSQANHTRSVVVCEYENNIYMNEYSCLRILKMESSAEANIKLHMYHMFIT